MQANITLFLGILTSGFFSFHFLRMGRNKDNLPKIYEDVPIWKFYIASVIMLVVTLTFIFMALVFNHIV